MGIEMTYHPDGRVIVESTPRRRSGISDVEH